MMQPNKGMKQTSGRCWADKSVGERATTQTESMRFVVYDVGNVRNRLVVDSQSWRALLQELVNYRALERAEANRLVWYLGGQGTGIGPVQAQRISGFVRQYFLPVLPRKSKLVLPAMGVEFDHSADDTPIAVRDLPWFEHSAHDAPFAVRDLPTEAALSQEWLEGFAELCSTCSGLGIVAEGIEP